MPPFAIILFLLSSTAVRAIGINYGTIANNLPPPSQVAAFIRDRTTIDKVKIFDANPDAIKAFAHTNISLTITVPDDAVPAVAKPSAARAWIAANVLPFFPATRIRRIAVGNEILATSNKTIIAHLLPAMTSIHSALQSAGIASVIQVSSPHSLGKISVSVRPSSGRFRRVYDRAIFAPILKFHRQTNSSFMICPYPFFGFTPETLNYALFQPNGGFFDDATGLNYTNMFDAQIDTVFSAMRRLGYGDVDIVVAETGWPSAGDSNHPEANLKNAMLYNSNLLKHVNSGVGTPLMPNRTFETYIFSLFNENLKPSTQEQNFGLFRPNFQPVFDIGILGKPQLAGSTREASRGGSEKKWCIPKSGATEAALQANQDFACGGGPCFEPENVRSQAAYAMNAYYQQQANGRRRGIDCDFNNTSTVSTSNNPSGLNLHHSSLLFLFFHRVSVCLAIFWMLSL